jgi:hypothetical protein
MENPFDMTVMMDMMKNLESKINDMTIQNASMAQDIIDMTNQNQSMAQNIIDLKSQVAASSLITEEAQAHIIKESKKNKNKKLTQNSSLQSNFDKSQNELQAARIRIEALESGTSGQQIFTVPASQEIEEGKTPVVFGIHSTPNRLRNYTPDSTLPSGTYAAAVTRNDREDQTPFTVVNRTKQNENSQVSSPSCQPKKYFPHTFGTANTTRFAPTNVQTKAPRSYQIHVSRIPKEHNIEKFKIYLKEKNIPVIDIVIIKAKNPHPFNYSIRIKVPLSYQEQISDLDLWDSTLIVRKWEFITYNAPSDQSLLG